MDLGNFAEALLNAVIAGEEGDADRITQEALAAGADPMALIRDAIQPAMDEIGKRYDCGDVFLPELIRSGDAGKAALDHIIPKLSSNDASAARAGTVIIGTMFGDNHDIGKNVVGALLVANGFKVVDVGINTPPKKFLEIAKNEGANIIAASTLITTALPYQREIVQLLRDSGNREKFFVVVGGGPVTPEWAKQIGADGYGRDAKDAVEACLRLVDGVNHPPLAEPVIVGALKR
jgi:methylmalonyl-CoA mutase cobalamin-binding domain/chain